jgi:hypothetical protein
MRFEVPQFIEIEDKIFGPLTWRQFLYLGGGVGLGVVLFLTFGFFVGLLIGLPLALLAGALAFYPINNRPFSFFLEAIVGYLRGTKLYIWQQKRDLVYKQNSTATAIMQDPVQKTNPTSPTAPVIPLARRLELEAMQKQDT